MPGILPGHHHRHVYCLSPNIIHNYQSMYIRMYTKRIAILFFFFRRHAPACSGGRKLLQEVEEDLVLSSCVVRNIVQCSFFEINGRCYYVVAMLVSVEITQLFSLLDLDNFGHFLFSRTCPGGFWCVPRWVQWGKKQSPPPLSCFIKVTI